VLVIAQVAPSSKFRQRKRRQC